MFTPKIRTERIEKENGLTIKDTHGFGFRLEIRSRDDINHKIEAKISKEASSRMKETMMNSRNNFGEVSETKFSQEITIMPNLEVEHDGSTESLEAYRDSVKVFSSHR